MDDERTRCELIVYDGHIDDIYIYLYIYVNDRLIDYVSWVSNLSRGAARQFTNLDCARARSPG